MSTTTTERQGLATKPERNLTKLDRCDSCSAQAFGVATKGEQELFFCGHHFKKNKEPLKVSGWEVEDYTDQINKEPSISSDQR